VALEHAPEALVPDPFVVAGEGIGLQVLGDRPRHPAVRLMVDRRRGSPPRHAHDLHRLEDARRPAEIAQGIQSRRDMRRGEIVEHDHGVIGRTGRDRDGVEERARRLVVAIDEDEAPGLAPALGSLNDAPGALGAEKRCPVGGPEAARDGADLLPRPLIGKDRVDDVENDAGREQVGGRPAASASDLERRLARERQGERVQKGRLVQRQETHRREARVHIPAVGDLGPQIRPCVLAAVAGDHLREETLQPRIAKAPRHVIPRWHCRRRALLAWARFHRTAVLFHVPASSKRPSRPFARTGRENNGFLRPFRGGDAGPPRCSPPQAAQKISSSGSSNSATFAAVQAVQKY